MRVDVAVIGAGTAGAAVTALCAQRGLSVLCLERGALEQAGARWLNGVPFSCFDAAGIPRPEGEELAGSAHDFYLVAGWRGPKLRVDRSSVPEVDMRMLVSRLQAMAVAAGAEFWGECTLQGTDEQPERVIVSTDRGQVQARWVVDASGLKGAGLLGQEPVAPQDLCAAAQQVRRLADPAAAAEFFAGHGVEPGTTLSFAGVAGGFSVLNVWFDGERVGLLTGSIPADDHRPGLRLLEDFAAEHAWIGETLFGGARMIPLRRPLPRLCSGRFAAVGDAARQVFPAHGSGIGVGLVAASVLADSLAAGSGVEGYNFTWQRRHGGLMAAYDLFRRHSQRLEGSELEQLMGCGVLEPESVLAAMEQRLPVPDPVSAVRKIIGLARAPRIARSLLPVLVRMGRVMALYGRYPKQPDAQLPWAARVARIFGELPATEGLGKPGRLTAAGRR